MKAEQRVPERIAVIGLGYVGLPVAAALAHSHGPIVGYDINAGRIDELAQGRDRNGQVSAEELKELPLIFSTNPETLVSCTFFIVTVPTPVDAYKKPDLSALEKATEIVGRYMRPGATVVFESTVYPGVTEDHCAPILEAISGLRRGVDFKLGYSPERMNPGDAEHTLGKITKVIAGEDLETLSRMKAVYSPIARELHLAPSIRVAEAAKVIENVQRDLNIALMNELSIIFDRMDIPTRDVLAAAETKWNFVRFTPGLVGGHCIGVDPYYLTCKAEQLGYYPHLILAGRRINDGMGVFIAQKVAKMLALAGKQVRGARVAILGLAFKENVADIRNSRVPDIVSELQEFGVETLVLDPEVDAKEVLMEYGIELIDWEQLTNLDGLVLAVPHAEILAKGVHFFQEALKEGGIIVDVRSKIDPLVLRADIQYWSL